MIDNPKIFDIADHLESYFKANGYTFSESLISSESRGEVVGLDRKVQQAGEEKRKAVLKVYKDLTTIGLIELNETPTHTYLNLKVNNGHSITHSILDDPDAMIGFVKARFDDGEITAEEAGCYFVALASYNLAKAEANARPANNVEAEMARLDGEEEHTLDLSDERLNAGIYTDAAKACLKEQRVPQSSADAQLMLADRPTFLDGYLGSDDEPLAQKGIEADGYCR